MKQVTSNEIKRVMSYIGSIKSDKKRNASIKNGYSNKAKHEHIFENKKCVYCGKYRSQFRGDPNKTLL